MIVGFKITNIPEGYEEDAIDFVVSKLCLVRDRVARFLRNKNYIYFVFDITQAELDALPFTAELATLTGNFYKNISDQKLEVPYAISFGEVKYKRLDAGMAFYTNFAEVQKMLNKDFVSRKLLALIDISDFILQEDYNPILDEYGQPLLEE